MNDDPNGMNAVGDAETAGSHCAIYQRRATTAHCPPPCLHRLSDASARNRLLKAVPSPVLHPLVSRCSPRHARSHRDHTAEDATAFPMFTMKQHRHTCTIHASWGILRTLTVTTIPITVASGDVARFCSGVSGWRLCTRRRGTTPARRKRYDDNLSQLSTEWTR